MNASRLLAFHRTSLFNRLYGARTKKRSAGRRISTLSRMRKDIRKMAQGRIQNWKQTRQTGSGVKIRRRGRKARIRARIRRRRRFVRGKRRYINWLYKNRPPTYYSVDQMGDNYYILNWPMYTGQEIATNAKDCVIINVEATPPQSIATQLCDYNCFKSSYKFIFHIGPGGDVGDLPYQVGYVRVLVFRRWGSQPDGIGTVSILSMFKYPYLATSGYCKGFRKVWLKQNGAQLYADKLLRISEETNWTTEFKLNIYPNIHTRYDSTVDRNRYYYKIILIGGFGASEKFGNLYTDKATPDSDNSARVYFHYNQINYWRYVNGMVLNTAGVDNYTISGVLRQDDPDAVRPNSLKMESPEETMVQRQDEH